ncbi:tetratricopeptide repeat protein [Actinoplanes sp. NPDC023936]|uniref:tetratricopeptide repeat protein n=1 Tax=Actinoplanes sp. NPDC023936 TaxID=3154910 RepID=UPI0033E7C175
MKTAEELWDLLHQAHELPYGAAQIALIEQVLRHVDTAGDPALAFYARLLATTAYIYGGEPVKSFPTFSWCVTDFDRKPAPYHERWTHNLLWLFKNMVSMLTKFPEVPLARTHAVLDDMERRYREHGRGMQAVYKHRYLVAEHVGQTEEAQAWFDKWQAAPRDELSDCAGCDPTSLANHLIGKGRFTEAVELSEPVLAGDLSCNEQPQSILSELMVAYLRSGHPAEAADAHRRSYLIERNNLADLGGIGDHIAFCARSGNEHRGLEILQRHIDWLDRAPSPSSAMWFAASSSLLLRRITERGHGDAVIRRTGKPDVTAAELADQLSALAVDTASRFDARNGTTHQSELIRRELNAEPYETAVQLSATARPTPLGPIAAPPPPVVPVPEPSAEIPAEASLIELLDLAERYQDDDRETALGEVVDAIGERFGVPDEPLLAARLWALRGYRLPEEAHAETIAVWEKAAGLFTEAGETGEAISMRARIAAERANLGEQEGVVEAVQAAADHQEQHGDAAKRASAWLRLSSVLVQLERLDEATAAGDRADECAAESGEPRRMAYHALMRARIRAMTHRHEEAVAAARAAWDFYRDHGPAGMSANAAMVFGQLTEDPAEALAAFDEVVAAGLPGLAFAVRMQRGRALLRLDRASEAIGDLVEAVALSTEQGMGESGAFARHELAQAYRMAGRTAEAIEVAEEALLRYERFEVEQWADDCRFLLAGLYEAFGDRTRALAGYRDLIERLADNPAGRGQIGERAGQLLYDMDRDSEAALTFQASAEALRESGDLPGELRLLRRRLMALNYADEVPAAEELIGLVAQRYAELPAELAAEPGIIWDRAIFAFETGNLLMRRDRFAEAVPHLRGAPELLRGIGATEDAERVTCMLAEALFRSGSPEEAEEMLDTLLAGLAPDAPARKLAEELRTEAHEAKKGLNDR